MGIHEDSTALIALKAGIAEGEKLRKEGNYHKAIEFFEKALQLLPGLKNNPEKVHVLMELGLLHWNIGQMESSSSYYEKALNQARISSQKEEQECLSALEIFDLYSKGKDKRSSGKHQESIDYFSQAIDLSRKINSPDHELKCLRQMSLNYWELNDIEEFHNLNVLAQRLAHETKNQKDEGICFNNIGLYYWKHCDYSNALRYFQIALEIAEKGKFIENKSDSLSNISLIYLELSDYEKALEYFHEVLRIDQTQKNDYNIAIDLNNIGNVYLNKGIQIKKTEYVTSALESYHSALELAKRNKNEKIESMILCNIGEAYYVLKEPKLALNHFNEALERANETQYKELISLLYNNIGNTFLILNTYDKAIDYFKNAIELALKIGSEKILWEAYFGLGQSYEKCNDYAKAIEYYEKSIEIIDVIRSQIHLDTFKTGYARNKLKVYERLIGLLWKMKIDGILASPEDKIFSFVERAKARAFLECLAESKVDVRERLSGKDRGVLNEASSRITSLVFNLAKTEGSGPGRQELQEKLVREEDNYMRLISRIRADNPAAANLVSPEAYRLELIQKGLLNGSSALIEYFLGDQQSLMLFITHNSAEIFPLPSRQAIEDSLKAYIKLLSSPPRAEIDGKIAGRRIFKDLLFPLEDKKNISIEKLIIIPDGILYYLPFETLVLEDGGHPSAYLIDRCQVSYAPSASVLMFLHEKKSSQGVFKGLLAFGDPVYPQETSPEGNSKTGDSLLAEIYLNQGFVFSPIPYSRDEIKYISKHFPKDQMDIYLGKDACEKALKENVHKDYQIIHFACHGFVDEQQSIRSALVLSQDKEQGDDGFLQVRELYNLRLNANLVILSACQTGKGTMERGEGVLGLPRIFFYSGAGSVVSTLWSIEDKTTAIFMGKFYQELSRGFSKAQALQLAKKEMIRSRYSHPFFWAGYVLNGESESPILFH